jgi:UPF0755 protein
VEGLAEAVRSARVPRASAGVSGAKTLDGFLMPETYYFDKQPNGPRAGGADARRSSTRSGPSSFAEVPGAEKYDKLAVVTMASMVEEEARLEDERPLVAAVLRNRLTGGHAAADGLHAAISR